MKWACGLLIILATWTFPSSIFADVNEYELKAKLLTAGNAIISSSRAIDDNLDKLEEKNRADRETIDQLIKDLGTGTATLAEVQSELNKVTAGNSELEKSVLAATEKVDRAYADIKKHKTERFLRKVLAAGGAIIVGLNAQNEIAFKMLGGYGVIALIDNTACSPSRYLAGRYHALNDWKQWFNIKGWGSVCRFKEKKPDSTLPLRE